MLELSIETKEDWWEVEALFDHCFAPGREALSSYRLRDDVLPIAELCLVVRDDFNVIGGAVRFWPVTVGGKIRFSLVRLPFIQPVKAKGLVDF